MRYPIKRSRETSTSCETASAYPSSMTPPATRFATREKFEAFPLLQVSEGEILALFVAQKVLAQYRGTPFEKTLGSAFQKLTGALKETVSFDLGEWGSDYSFRVTGASAADLEVFRLLARAIVQRQEISFSYQPLRASAPETRTVHPYHLANIDNAWYLLAHDPQRAQIRTFALPRESRTPHTDKKDIRSAPSGFSADEGAQRRIRGLCGHREAPGQSSVRLLCSPPCA